MGDFFDIVVNFSQYLTKDSNYFMLLCRQYL
jgi:hypothetical protein